MELQVLKVLLVRFLEGDQLKEEEGEQLLAGLEQLIERNELHLLVGIKYCIEEEKVLSEYDLKEVYWEVHMFYGHHEDDHDHHDETATPVWQDFIYKWGWLHALLTGLVAALAYMLIRRYGL
ncbi:hypothetical protein [Chitinophaga sp. CF418]|uniref:hypothetical protein n=1 Tax=Chitinophaga sp. CF418 TaxID=1855287 RepID=UPI000912B515|nr:hypothetical protein [Chitinophaga sp. CF418]SHN22578.1 hypothetical protein SAMN05216311_10767 [Chitinophaga sp. CF418]